MNRKLYLITNTQSDDGAAGLTTPVQTSTRSMWVWSEELASEEINEAGSSVTVKKRRFVGRYSDTEPVKGQTLGYNGEEYRIHSYQVLDQKNQFIEIVGMGTGLSTSLTGDDTVPGGAAGELPGGRFDANSGTAAEALPYYMQYDLFDLTTGSVVEIMNTGICVIDWGDGNGIQSYTDTYVIQKTYAAGEYTDRQATVKVYHNHNITAHILIGVSGTAFVKCNSVGGTIPTSLTQFSVTQVLLQTIPTLPVACKRITLTSNSIDEAQMNTFVAGLVTNAQVNGTLTINNQIPAISYTTMTPDLETLKNDRGWTTNPDV